MQHHNDTINNRRVKNFKKIYLSLYCKGSKRVTQGFTVRGSWRLNRTAIYWPPLLWPSALCLSRSPGLLNRRPSSLLDDGFLYCTLSPTGLQNSIGGPEGPFGRVWLSSPLFVSDDSDPQLSDFLFWPSYIIVQRSLNRPLNLWNGLFDRHQAEITVMPFIGHSLPVRQSMSVSWAFTLSHFISQIRLRDFFQLLAIGMCHFLPVHHFGMACLLGPKVNI